MITVVPPKDRETVVSDATSSNFTDVTDQTHESGVMESSLPGGMAGNDGVVIPEINTLILNVPAVVIESTRRGSGFSEGLTLDPPSSTPKRSRSILKTPNSGTTPSSPGFGANLSDPLASPDKHKRRGSGISFADKNGKNLVEIRHVAKVQYLSEDSVNKSHNDDDNPEECCVIS